MSLGEIYRETEALPEYGLGSDVGSILDQESEDRMNLLLGEASQAMDQNVGNALDYSADPDLDKDTENILPDGDPGNQPPTDAWASNGDRSTLPEDRALVERNRFLMDSVLIKAHIPPYLWDDARQEMIIRLIRGARSGASKWENDAFKRTAFRRAMIEALRSANHIKRHVYANVMATANPDDNQSAVEGEKAADTEDENTLTPEQMQTVINAMNVCFTVRLDDLESEIPGPANSTQEPLAQDINQWLDGAFSKLDLLDKLLISLRLELPFLDNKGFYMSGVEIAGILGVTDSAVGRLYSQALNRLAALYNGDKIKKQQTSAIRERHTRVLLAVAQEKIAATLSSNLAKSNK